MQSYLIQGDPLAPTSGDLIAQTDSLAWGDPIPDGWRVLDGNTHHSVIARVVMRYEVEDSQPAEPEPEDTPTLDQLADEYDDWLRDNWPRGLSPGERMPAQDVYKGIWRLLPGTPSAERGPLYDKLYWLLDYMTREYAAERREADAQRGEG